MSGTGSGLTSTSARRRRTLAHLSPIFDVHLNRARNPSKVLWAAYDFVALTQACVDTIALASGLDGNLGAPRTEVLEQMARIAGTMAPHRPAEEHDHVARHLLDHLLRHEEPTPYFCVEYADPDADWQPVSHQVRILFETLAADGRTLYVNADNTAVTLLLIATNRSLEDEHEAVIAVMQAQMASGRLDAAIDSAEDALALSRTYAANVRRLINEAERDVTRVDYLNVLRPELTSAARHLERRVDVDGTLLRHLENLRADASEEQEPVAVRQLSLAAARLGDAVETLAGLQTEVIRATPRWREAQAAQAFSAVPASEIDPTTHVLSALLTGLPLPPGADLCPPSPSLLLDVGALADRLAVPPQQIPEAEAAPLPTEPLQQAEGVYEQFPEQFHNVAHVIRTHQVPAGSKTRLTDLLANADRLFSGRPSTVVDELTALAGGAAETARRRLRLLLALDAMMLWRPDARPDAADEWWAIDDGIRGTLPDLDVPDLLIHRKGCDDDRS